MKKFALGLIVGLILFIPVTALAEGNFAPTPWTNVIYRISGSHQAPQVSVFDDEDNKCYVATPDYTRDTKPSISCVKK